MPFIEVGGVTKSYPVGGTLLTVLRGLDLTLEQGELDSIDQGTIRIGDAELGRMSDAELVAFRNTNVGFVFQFHHLLPEFTALENAEMPMRIARRAAAERRTRAQGLLTRVGLGERLEHRPGMLSGGEQQRVAIARALVMEPALLLADEPTGDLDEHTADMLHDLLRDMHRERGLTSIIATHNPKLAASCDRVLRLEEGRLRPESTPNLQLPTPNV
jgi:lipoprotein-releasing system ATP-binding protein